MSSTLLAGLVVAGGAAVAAPLRYVTGLAVQSVHDTVFPWGTFAVNVTGSLLLGIVAGAVGAGAPAGVLTLVGTGVCGAMTTFSTFGFETVRLLEDDALGGGGSRGSGRVRFANIALTWRGEGFYSTGAAEAELAAGADLAAVQSLVTDSSFGEKLS